MAQRDRAPEATPNVVDRRRVVPKMPLAGVRVVDFSWVMAGPMATKMLGALGAEVIKIESSLRPEFAFREAWFAVINNNKKSCTLDITKPEAQACIRDIVATSDVVVENFSARVLAKNNVAYEDLVRIKPDIIFVSASGLGREGPERDMLAYGSLLQAYSGRVGPDRPRQPGARRHGRHAGLDRSGYRAVGDAGDPGGAAAPCRDRRRVFHRSLHARGNGRAAARCLLHAGLGRQPASAGASTSSARRRPVCFRCHGEDDWLALSVRDDAEWAALCRAAAARSGGA